MLSVIQNKYKLVNNQNYYTGGVYFVMQETCIHFSE